MKIRCPGKAQSGMSLVEVIMAIALLGIVAGGVLGSFRYGFFSLQLLRENQRATQILLEKVETLRLYSWDQVNSNGFVPTTFTDVYDPQGATGAKGTGYTGTLTVAACPLAASYSTNLRQLTVSLRWTTGTVPHTRTLATYIAKDGMQNYVY